MIDIKVTDNNGNIVTSYNNEITGNLDVQDKNTKNILYIVIILLAIIFSIIVSIALTRSRKLAFS